MYLPHALLLAGQPPPSQPSTSTPHSTQSRGSQSQLLLGLVPTGDLALVRERVRKDALDKWDALTPRAQVRLHGGRLWFPEAAQSDFAASLRPTSWATAQFCQRLGIPAGYFRRCPSKLQDLQFNHWIRQPSGGQETPPDEEDDPLAPERTDEDAPLEVTRFDEPGEEDGAALPESWLLRMKGDTLRGVLSARYARLDHDLLLDSLTPLLPPGFTVDWFSLDDTSLHLRLVDPRKPQSVLPGDDLLSGIHLANSEVGRRAVTVDALVYRLVCQNGLIRLVKGKSLMHQRHIHLSAPHFREALEGAVLGALDEASRFLEQIRTAARTPVPDVPAVLALLGRQEALSKSFLEAAERSLRSEPSGQQETVWGLANGLTQASQALPPDDRYAIETLAGRLIEHGPPKVPARTIQTAGTSRRASHPPLTGETTRTERTTSMEIVRRGRFWAVHDGAGQLVCVAVYQKGAREVVRRLSPAPVACENSGPAGDAAFVGKENDHGPCYTSDDRDR